MAKAKTAMCAIAAMVAVGCASNVPSAATKGRREYAVARVTADPCPLCGAPAHLRRCWVDYHLHRGLRAPDGIEDPNWLYNCGCTNRDCLVESRLPYSYWRAEEAAAEWNRKTRKYAKEAGK